MKASILSVGTELTDGQIVNKNAAWLSEQIKPLGLRACLHLTIPDHRETILKTLEFAARETEIIFLTGGLGPTSDDFTRDLVAQWSQKELIFNEASWKKVQDRLSSRGFPVQDFQKQQCFFPLGSSLLSNPQGTADGFWLSLPEKNKTLIVLPGPPREIQAIWEFVLKDKLLALTSTFDPTITKSWDVIGLGESQVATLTEPLIKDSDVEVGYRVHLPYVEFKISFPQSQTSRFSTLVAQIELALKQWTALRDGEDAVTLFTQRLKNFDLKKIVFIDTASETYLLQRLQLQFRQLFYEREYVFSNRHLKRDKTGVCFWLNSLDGHRLEIGMQMNQQTFHAEAMTPYSTENMSERRKQYFAELALLQWCDWLKN